MEVITGLRSHYRSGHDDLGRDFFRPCLEACHIYQRAVAFFSSSSLATWSGVLPSLIERAEVRIQLLIAPVLSEADRNTLRSVATAEGRKQVLRALADRIVEDAVALAAEPTNALARRNLLAWMIASQRLELRTAFPEDPDASSLFHEKIGIFGLPGGMKVAFTGSANETLFGHCKNYESIDVFRSWIPEDVARVQIKEQQFAEAWDGHLPGLDVLPLSPAALERIKLQSLDAPVDSSAEERARPSRWRHQDDAIRLFLEKERGILEMATGTGKTRTALRLLEHLINHDLVECVVIAADGNDLLDQWGQQVLQLLPSLNRPFSVLRHYGTYHERQKFVFDPLYRILLVSRTALPPPLRNISGRLARRCILIHDEVHRLGSPGNRQGLAGLSAAIRYRLGLSATPDREYDAEGNDFIAEHIGPRIFQFDLAQAIERGVLAPFNYYPIRYTPDENDRLRIQAVHARAAAREQAGDPMTKEQVWIELAKVYKTSLAKLPLFSSFLATRTPLLKRCIVFVETREYGDEVLDIIHQHRADFHTYYAAEDSEVLRRFAEGEIQCLLTCHRLSEGIDIRSLETVVLFSSSRARLETIQRMGRCLRVDPNNPSKRANVVDFVRVKDESTPDVTADELRQLWLEQLARVEPGEGLNEC